ncbi:MAG: 30S ribosomal protein S9 [Patescibacteria group bacterium]|jgi:small subunit ribosomal protein S9
MTENKKPETIKEVAKEVIQEKQAGDLAGKYYYGTGRRKRAIAQVRLYRGNGKFTVNKKELKVYFKNADLRDIILEPYKSVGQEGKFDTTVKVLGGGSKGQAEAVRLGISRALVVKNQTYKVPLKKSGFLTRDPRETERKKPGLKKARRAPQWAKR